MAIEILWWIGCTVLVLGSYSLALWLFRRARRMPLLHPLLTGGTVIALVLASGRIDYNFFRDHSRIFYWLLGPATVALAVPLHQEQRRLRALARPVLLTLLAGALAAPLTALLLAWLLDGGDLLLALSTKSVTTPIALGIGDIIGSKPELVAGAVTFTGVSGALLVPRLLAYLGIGDERVVGFTLGLNAHGIGTARAFEKSPACGAWASLAMCLTGLLTSALLPLVVRLVAR